MDEHLQEINVELAGNPPTQESSETALGRVDRYVEFVMFLM